MIRPVAYSQESDSFQFLGEGEYPGMSYQFPAGHWWNVLAAFYYPPGPEYPVLAEEFGDFEEILEAGHFECPNPVGREAKLRAARKARRWAGEPGGFFRRHRNWKRQRRHQWR